MDYTTLIYYHPQKLLNVIYTVLEWGKINISMQKKLELKKYKIKFDNINVNIC